MAKFRKIRYRVQVCAYSLQFMPDGGIRERYYHSPYFAIFKAHNKWLLDHLPTGKRIHGMRTRALCFELADRILPIVESFGFEIEDEDALVKALEPIMKPWVKEHP